MQCVRQYANNIVRVSTIINYVVEDAKIIFRLLILVFLVIFNKKPITCHKEGRFQSSGQLQRPYTIASTRLPVMSGAMAVSSMRYGHWDTNHFMILPMPRYIAASKLKIC